MSDAWLEQDEPAAESGEELVYRYGVRVGSRELDLEPGETLIGRGDECHVGICEALVSRRHARIVIGDGRPFIEDLGSANGTFLNQTRIQGRAELCAGDRIFIGTCEIELIRRVDEDRPTIPLFERPVHRAPQGGASPLDTTLSGRMTARERLALAEADFPSDGPSTVRDARSELEHFESVARLADKTLTMGRVEAALRILAGPLEEMLERSRRGRPPGTALLEVMGRYAVKLANETLDGHWVDLAIEAHLLAARPLHEETIQQLASLRARSPLGNDELIAQYYAALRAKVASFSAADRILCERVACLLPALGKEDKEDKQDKQDKEEEP